MCVCTRACACVCLEVYVSHDVSLCILFVRVTEYKETNTQTMNAIQSKTLMKNTACLEQEKLKQNVEMEVVKYLNTEILF